MKLFTAISILIILLFITTSCEKENDNNTPEEFQYEATVINKGLDCGETFLISIKGLYNNSELEDGTYYADQLDSDFKVPGLKIYLNCREPDENEIYACTHMGPTYPHVIVTDCKIKEDSNDNLTLLGKWTYNEDYSKTLDFQNSTDVIINGQEFLYKIEGDSIEFSYNGHLYIAVIPSKHKYETLSDTDYLMIEDLDNLQFFYGNSGENILLCCIEPNDFIGTWISVYDTLIFRTNDRFERNNEIYEYNYTDDSLTMQIIRADIFMGPLKSKYNLKMDTLLIYYSSVYYPDIQKGELRYERK